MKTTIDKAGRVVIPAPIRDRLCLKPGTELEVEVEDGSVRLVRRVSGPRLVREGNRWVVRPTVAPRDLPAVDIGRWVQEERDRWRM